MNDREPRLWLPAHTQIPASSLAQAHADRKGVRPESPLRRTKRDKNYFSFLLSSGTTMRFSVEGSESPPQRKLTAPHRPEEMSASRVGII